VEQIAVRRIFFTSLLLVGASACSTEAPATSPSAGGHGGTGGAAAVNVGGAVGAGAAAGGAAVGGEASAGSATGGVSGAFDSAGGGASGGAAAGASMAGNAGAAGGGGSSCGGLWCEDFESGKIDPAKWDTQTMGGTVMLQSARSAHGKYAAQFHGQAGTSVSNDYAFLIAHQAPAALSTHHFGRLYFFVTPKPTSGHTGMVFAGTTGFPKPAYLEVANINGGWQLGYVKLNGPPNGEEVAYPPGQVPVETWSCLEWEFNDQPDEATLWIDGKELGKLNDQTIGYPPGHVPGSPIFDGKSSGLVGGFSDFGVGFYDWHPKNAFDLFYDDIVIDTARVGCLPP
jgi:hypothetical protein